MTNRGEGIGQVDRVDTSLPAFSRDRFPPKFPVTTPVSELVPTPDQIDSSSDSSKWSRMSRRRFLGLGAAGVASIPLRGLPYTASAAESNVASSDVKQPETAEIRNAAVELAVGEANYALPVSDEERDIRISNIALTKLVVDPSMMENPPGVPVKGIEIYDRFSKWEGRNQLTLAATNAMIRAHFVSQEYLEEGDDYAKLYQLLQRGELPIEPNWADYANRIVSGETFPFRIMALPEGAPAAVENLQWMEANVNKGVILNYTADPGLTHSRYIDFKYDNPEDGWSIRVMNDGKTQFDIYNNLSQSAENETDQQGLYDYAFSATALRAFMSLTMTLGIFERDTSSLFGKIFMKNYQDLLSQNYFNSIFSEQNELLLGPMNSEVIYPDRLLHVKLQK